MAQRLKIGNVIGQALTHLCCRSALYRREVVNLRGSRCTSLPQAFAAQRALFQHKCPKPSPALGVYQRCIIFVPNHHFGYNIDVRRRRQTRRRRRCSGQTYWQFLPTSPTVHRAWQHRLTHTQNTTATMPRAPPNTATGSRRGASLPRGAATLRALPLYLFCGCAYIAVYRKYNHYFACLQVYLQHSRRSAATAFISADCVSSLALNAASARSSTVPSAMML